MKKTLDNSFFVIYNIICACGKRINKTKVAAAKEKRDLSSAGRASALQAEGHSWLEHTVHTRGVEGSNPPSAIESLVLLQGFFFIYINRFIVNPAIYCLQQY